MSKEAEKLRLQKDDELKALLSEYRAKRFHLQSAFGKDDKEGKVREGRAMRKSVARINTILHERKKPITHTTQRKGSS